MDAQQIIALGLGVAAAALVLRHVWRQVKGLIHPEQAGCAGCEGCDPDAADRRAKVVPLLTIGPRRGARPAGKGAEGSGPR